MKLKSGDQVLILVLLLFALLGSMGYREFQKKSEKEAVVYVGDEEYARYPMKKDAVRTVTGVDGGVNSLIIRDGEVDVTYATCPDQICVKQSPVSEIGEVIVCLPHQVVVAIESSSEQ